MSASSDQHVELPITGMTCTSCANRIERKLNELDGLRATVNYATEKAAVSVVANALRLRRFQAQRCAPEVPSATAPGLPRAHAAA